MYGSIGTHNDMNMIDIIHTDVYSSIRPLLCMILYIDDDIRVYHVDVSSMISHVSVDDVLRNIHTIYHATLDRLHEIMYAYVDGIIKYDVHDVDIDGVCNSYMNEIGRMMNKYRLYSIDNIIDSICMKILYSMGDLKSHIKSMINL